MSFWPNLAHWSVEIPLQTNHYRMPVLADTGVVELAPLQGEIPESDAEKLQTVGDVVAYIQQKAGK